MIGRSSDRLTIGCCDTIDAAMEYINIKKLSGWNVLVPPFTNKQPTVNLDQDISVPAEWIIILHRF